MRLDSVISALSLYLRLSSSQGRGFTGRALAARTGETEKIQFLCGTQSLRHENQVCVCVCVCVLDLPTSLECTARQLPLPLPVQVHLLDYNDDTGVLDKTAFPHTAGTPHTPPTTASGRTTDIHIHVHIVVPLFR